MQSTIAPYLLSTYQMIKRAFPNGIEPEVYLPLLAILDDELSDRNLAEIVAHYTGKDYGIILNDVYRAKSTAIPTPEAIAKVKQRLLICGYEEWLNE